MKIVRLLPILLLLCVSSLFAQSKIKIQGEVNVPFSSIRLFKGAALVTGTIGNEKGKFTMEVAPGVYDLLVESIGYEALKMTNQSFTSSTNLGIITVKESNQTLNEVVVKGQKASMELNLDKRIFNVGTDLANKGATASEILGNLPSIQVDPEGAIKLRGSDNVRILIDGKPSTLAGINGSSGLQSLQGNLIDKVEIITNPSARYEAEGMAGIINIVLKKNQNQGFNGAIETTTGYPENFGGTAIVNYRKNKFNFFINYGVFYRRTPGRGSIYQEVYTGKQTNILEQRSQNNVTGLVNNVRGGADYFFNDKTILTASYIFRRTDVQRITDFNYLDYRGNVFNLNSDTYRQQDEKEAEPNGEYALTFKKSFAKKGEEFSADLRYLDYWERSDQTYTQNGKKADGSVFPELSKVQKALNDEFERQWILQADYVNPIGKDAKIEMGVRTSYRNMINDYIVTEQQPSGIFTIIPGLRNVFNYKENISAAYFIFGNKMKQFSYQFGLRAETTDIQTELEQTGEKNPRNYANLFPSAHFTYTITPDNSFQLSYSRRVRRPTYNDLSPFVTFSDNRNFFSGNPNLNPEFTNSFDLGNVRYFDKGSVSSSLYYRHTLGKIDRFRSVDTSGFAKTLPVNLSDQQSMGIEIASSYTFTKAYKADLSINAFRAITDATNINAAFKSDTYSWFVRHSSRIKLGAVDFQVRANYEAPQQTPQGTRGYIAWADFSASKDILQGNGTLSLSILDLFSSRINRYESRFLEPTDGSGFYTRGESQGRLTSLNLTFNYRFKTTKQAAKQRRSLMDEEN